MSLNLHAAARGAVTAVNADVSAWWYQSNGASVDATTGRQVPSYLAPCGVKCQVQPPSGKDLRFIEFLQLQGVIRSVWMYSNPQAIVRVNQKGNDLLLFPQFSGEPNDVWLVAKMDETWSVGCDGWSKVYCVLQTDRLYSNFDGLGRLILNGAGQIVTN